MNKKKGAGGRGPGAGEQPKPRAASRSLSGPTAFGAWPFLWAAAALVVVWWAYSPALYGPFVFDDMYLPFAIPGLAGQPLGAWVRGVRPLLMFTYWLNMAVSGGDPFSYHAFGVLLHCVTAGLIFAIVRRLLGWQGVSGPRGNLPAGFAAALFLLHPAQTEAVAYLSSRSDLLSVMFAMAAFAIFLYREGAGISWGRAGAVLALFGLAILSKEQAVVLPALLLLTDYWWNPGFSTKGIRANWRLYVPMAVGAAGGIAFFRDLILHSTSAGFGMKDLPWYQYLFTQFRAIFVYLQVFALPVNLTADRDFPFSRTILDHGAIFGLIALAGLAAAAWWYRRRFPLASYGYFAFLTLLAPTSSILPIQDPVVERRLYFSMLGLLLIVVDLLARLKVERRSLAWGCAGVVLLAGIATYARAGVWSSPVALWEDTARKSPGKPRPHFQLAMAYQGAGRYDAALAEFEKTSHLQPPEYSLLLDWALAYDNINRPADALAKLQQAATLQPTAHVYSQIGMIYAKQQRWVEALEALATAEKIDPNWAPTYNYRAKIHVRQSQFADAVANYRRALALDPTLEDARSELARTQAMVERGGR